MGMVITHSDMSQFLSCRRAWWLSFILDRRPPKKVHGPLALGTRVHDVLEYIYNGGDDPITYHDALASKDLAWQDDNDVTGWMVDELYSDIVIGRNLIRHYLEWVAETGADDGLEVVATEQVIEVPILDDAVTLRGKLDIKWRRTDSGLLILNDWKTSGRWDTGARAALERSYQHHFYMAIENLLHPEDPVTEAWYTVLIKTKSRKPSKPVIERFKVPGTVKSAPIKLKQIETIAAEMLRAVEERSQYPSPGQSCGWCDYKMPCELADGMPDAARQYLEDQYVVGGKHERYTDAK